jgi:hypothetical protein
MKKAILFFLFIGITYLSKAQLTVSGFGGSQGYNTTPSTFYTLNPPVLGPSFPSPFIADAGTNVYKINSFSGGIYNTNLIARIGNYWYIGQQTSISVGSGNFVHTKTLTSRTKVVRPTNDPPCIDIWENVSYVESTNIATPLGTYFTATLGGSTCDASSFGTTMLPNLTSLPQLTNAGIQALTSPTAGSIVYNTDCNCISMYNGVSWNCLSYSNMITVTTSGYSIAGFYNHILYTGSVGTMTIPAASICPNQEYYITNNGAGNLTLSIAFVTGNATTTAIISQNTTVHLMSNGTNWIKI